MYKHKGFTLIEALVASMILFAVITSMSMLYQSTIKAELKAKQSIEYSSAIPFILDQIRYQIRNERIDNGEGYAQGAYYHWNASEIDRKAGYVPEGLEDEYGAQQRRFVLWSVTLTVENRAPIVYKEFSW
ncbi:PilW family protein [Vibrio diabolicus]|uniref:PilW family protein n=1 Tax=Vibrio TaxID=662 RepID=UPI00265A41CB|nr:prepilin-type N-terminal cleavage/methylation domain-containing protein [Vibrio alginolyticus]